MKTPQLLGAFCACVFSLFTSTSHAASIPSQGTWMTTLHPRDLDGNPNTIEAYYDTDLNITWLANADLAASNTFGLPYDTDLGEYPGNNFQPTSHIYSYSEGTMDWGGALFWIAAMNSANYLGHTGWRLPTAIDVNNDGPTNYNATTGQGDDYGSNIDTANGEMAHMFYDTLGNTAAVDTTGALTGCIGIDPDHCLTNTGPFNNLTSGDGNFSGYWYGTPDASNTGIASYFDFYNGNQWTDFSFADYYSWAVHDGDIGVAVSGTDPLDPLPKPKPAFMPWLPLLLK